MQHYDVLGDYIGPTDGVYNMLDFILLKWERHEEDNEAQARGKAFALCPFDRVRGI